VTNTPRLTSADLQEAAARNLTARDITAELATALPNLEGVWRILYAALADAPPLMAELSDERRAHADLLAAARATLTAAHDAEPDPLYYLRDELGARGQLPSAGGGRS